MQPHPSDDAPIAEQPVHRVSLDLLEREPRPGLLDRALEVLRTERLIGLVGRDDLMQAAGALAGELAVERSVALVAGADGVEEGLSLEAVAARIARALDAAVLLAPAEDDAAPGLAAAPVSVIPGGFDPDAALAERLEAAMAGSARVVSLVPLDAAAVRPRLPELAQGAGGRAVLVPADGRALVVTESPRFPTWWGAAKPVLAVVAADDRIDLLAWTRRPVAASPGRMQRWAGEADWGIGWNDPSIGVQGDGAAPAVLALQDRLRTTELSELPRVLAAQLGWDAERLAAVAALWREPLSAVPVERIVAAIGAPEAMTRLLHGGDPALEPGAVAYEPRGMGATLADAMILASRPKGDTWWSRYEAWWWRRPGLSTVVGAGILVLIGVLAVAATIGDSWSWWRAIVCAVGAMNGIGLLGSAALARRERRQRSAA